MERLKIIVDDKEIAKRYVGDRLVWEGITLLLRLNYATVLKRKGEVMLITLYGGGMNTDNVTKIVLDDLVLTEFNSLRLERSNFKFKLSDSDTAKLKEGRVNNVEFWGRG
jgi:hypothetical protein